MTSAVFDVLGIGNAIVDVIAPADEAFLVGNALTKGAMMLIDEPRAHELYGKMAQVAPTLEEALGIANRAVTKEDLICITGSFYLVGQAKKHFAAKATNA